MQIGGTEISTSHFSNAGPPNKVKGTLVLKTLVCNCDDPRDGNCSIKWRVAGRRLPDLLHLLLRGFLVRGGQHGLCAKRGRYHELPLDGRIGTAKSSAADQCSMILSRKSRAPKCGFWLMRGAQPATSAGARLFAGSPIPAFLTTPKGDEEINLALAGFELAALRALSGSPAISAKRPHIVV